MSFPGRARKGNRYKTNVLGVDIDVDTCWIGIAWRDGVGSKVQDGIGSFAGIDPAKPAGEEGGVKAIVPVSPFTAGELDSLFAGEEDEDVVFVAGLSEHGMEISDLGIHVGNLGEVGRELLVGERGVGQIRRASDFLGRGRLKRCS